jgi:hypothetical protein
MAGWEAWRESMGIEPTPRRSLDATAVLKTVGATRPPSSPEDCWARTYDVPDSESIPSRGPKGGPPGENGGGRGWTSAATVRGCAEPCSLVLMVRSVHDNYLVSYEVLSEQRKIVLRTEYRDGREVPEVTSVIFTGVEGYHFELDCFGNILFGVERVPVERILEERADEVRAAADYVTWPWVKDPGKAHEWLSGPSSSRRAAWRSRTFRHRACTFPDLRSARNAWSSLRERGRTVTKRPP